MKNLFKMVGWYLVLIIFAVGCICTYKNIDTRKFSTEVINYAYYTSDDYYDDDDFKSNNNNTYDNSYNNTYDDSSDVSLFPMIFMELFVTIHMTVFVLKPLSTIFAKEKSKQKSLLKKLFIARVIILIIGDITIGFPMAVADFFTVFLGAFILVPICGIAKGTKVPENQNVITKSDNDSIVFYESYGEISDSDLLALGFGDKEVLKKVLVKHYEQILLSFAKQDFASLAKLCGPKVLNSLKAQADLYNKAGEQFVIYDITLSPGSLRNGRKTGKEIFFEIDVSCQYCEYVLDKNNSLVRGSKIYKKSYLKKLFFKKTISDKVSIKCPNCNATIDEDNVEFCSYCGTRINFTGNDWILTKEIVLKEGE